MDRSVLDVGEEYHDKFYQKCLKGDCYHPGYFKHVVLPKVEKAQKQKNSPEFISENSRPAVSQPLKLFRDIIAYNCPISSMHELCSGTSVGTHSEARHGLVGTLRQGSLRHAEIWQRRCRRSDNFPAINFLKIAEPAMLCEKNRFHFKQNPVL